MANNNENPQTRALNKRTARMNGHLGICIPAEYIGRTYERYTDTVIGIITLIPTDRSTREDRETTSTQMITIDSSLFAVNRQAATYADGKYLCGECRAEYMDLHHPPDPFCDVFAKRSGGRDA